MSIDLKIPGDPGAIRETADWLDPLLKGALLDAEDDLKALERKNPMAWSGAAAYACVSAITAIRTEHDEIPRFITKLAQVMHAYAGRLERGQEEFSGYANYARDHSLSVQLHVVAKPTTTLASCPAPDAGPSPEVDEWTRYMERVDAYNAVSSAVGTWWGTLDAWIGENLVPLIGEVELLREGHTAQQRLIEANKEVVSIALDTAEQRATRDLESFREGLASYQEDAATFTQQLRSGNPALRAAAEAADPKGMRHGVQAMSESISGIARSTRIIPLAGPVIDVVATGAEIAGGASPTNALAGLLGAAGGAGAATAVATGLGVTAVAPPVAIVVGVAAAAWATGEAAKWLWEAWVPLDDREYLDAGIRDFLDVANPTNWFVDTP